MRISDMSNCCVPEPPTNLTWKLRPTDGFFTLRNLELDALTTVEKRTVGSIAIRDDGSRTRGGADVVVFSGSTTYGPLAR